MNSSDIKAFDIKQLLDGKSQYIIPIYQRNYAWESKEIEQLIQDIIDYSLHHSNKNYYIGTLVVATGTKDSAEYFTTIDGQQRLTTLSILTAVIRNHFKEIDTSWYQSLNIQFASREKSATTLNAVFNGEFEDIEYERKIESAYKICERELKLKTKENRITVKDFADYLYEYVTILRVPLPAGIDLNHYFEIMNSRGEQLEKHEILKAKLMECFSEDPAKELNETCFNMVWEACANMEKYVQYGFTPEQRHRVFGRDNWNTLTVFSFDELTDTIKETLTEIDENEELTIDQIVVKDLKKEKPKEEEEGPDRFNAVINFQNFLLHVLRVQTASDRVALDDKRLIELFMQEMPAKKSDQIAFVKQFAFNLLKCKLLFDKYIIKREFTANTDRWSLRSLKNYSKNNVKNGVRYPITFGEDENNSFDSDNR